MHFVQRAVYIISFSHTLGFSVESHGPVFLRFRLTILAQGPSSYVKCCVHISVFCLLRWGYVYILYNIFEYGVIYVGKMTSSGLFLSLEILFTYFYVDFDWILLGRLQLGSKNIGSLIFAYSNSMHIF